MKTVTIDASEDLTHPAGGYAVVLLRGATAKADSPQFRLRAVEGTNSTEGIEWPHGLRRAQAVRSTDAGLELLLGPDIVDNPHLVPGTIVAIEVPEADSQGEFHWPNVAPTQKPKKRLALSKKPKPSPPIVPMQRDQQAAPESFVLDEEPELVLHTRLADTPLRLHAETATNRPFSATSAITDFLASAEHDRALQDLQQSRQNPEGVITVNPEAPEPSTVVQALESSKTSAIDQREPRLELRDTSATTFGWSDKTSAPPNDATTPRWHYPLAAVAVTALGLFLGNLAFKAFNPQTTRVAATLPIEATQPPVPPLPSAAKPQPIPAATTATTTTADFRRVEPAALPPTSCGPVELFVEPHAHARMRLRIVSPCRANETIRIHYAETTLHVRLSRSGDLEVTLDLFAGLTDVPVVELADRSSHALPIETRDRDTTATIALVWKRPIDLDLHVFENGARFGERGHVAVVGAPALGGRGTLTTSARGDRPGDQIEIYSVPVVAGQPPLQLAVAVDFATRGDRASSQTCEGGADARLPFTLIYRTPDGTIRRSAAALSPAACNRPISNEARFNRDVLPGLALGQ